MAAKAAPVGTDFADLPDSLVVGHREEDLVGVVVQFDIADQPDRLGLENRSQRSALANVIEHNEFIFPGVDVGDLVLLPGALLRQP